MGKRNKKIFGINALSLFLIAVSFMSVTLAWFAYSGLANLGLDIDVKAWDILLTDGDKRITNNITLSENDIYPGMETVYKRIDIKNLGDTDADLSYSIFSARILDEELDVSGDDIEDLLSHGYPFKININLDKRFVLIGGKDKSFIEMSISWPLDSDQDEFDSEWGSLASEFQRNEIERKKITSSYEIRPAVNIVIALQAEQAFEDPTKPDQNFTLGEDVLIQIITGRLCGTISANCLKTYVIDPDNKIGDDTVTLLPNPYGSSFTTFRRGPWQNYTTMRNQFTSSWGLVTTRGLRATDIMKVISNDASNTLLIRPDLSDSILGNIEYENRMTSELQKLLTGNGEYSFASERFEFIISSDCYWLETEYDTTRGFALRRYDGETARMFGYLKGNTCNVIPVIIANKNQLTN